MTTPCDKRCMQDVTYCAANTGDSDAVADYLLMAEGGFFEFMLDDLIPGLSSKQLLAQAVASPEGLRSHQNCYVAELNSRVVGAINVFPVDALTNEDMTMFPSERLVHISALSNVQDWGNMFFSSIAVDPYYQNKGIGRHLLNLSMERTREDGFNRLSLHVWADNTVASCFYLRHSFREISRVNIQPHPRFNHVGGSILMNRLV